MSDSDFVRFTSSRRCCWKDEEHTQKKAVVEAEDRVCELNLRIDSKYCFSGAEFGGIKQPNLDKSQENKRYQQVEVVYPNSVDYCMELNTNDSKLYQSKHDLPPINT